MQQKDVIAFLILFSAGCGGVLLACLSKRIRDLFFVLIIPAAAVTEYIDVNFVSRDWYRGTTCGFEVSMVDVLSVSLLVSSILVPRRGEKRSYWPASLGFMLMFFAYACFSVAISEPKLWGLFELSKMVRGIIMFLAVAFYVRSERELRLFVFALGLAVLYEGFRGVEQRYVYGIQRVFANLDAPNSLSMYMCMTAPVFVTVLTSRFPRILKIEATCVIMLAFISVLLTVSRAGLVIICLVLLASAVITVSIKVTPQKLGVALLILIGLGGALAKGWKTIDSRFQGDSLRKEYEDKHAMGRGYYIRIAAAIADDHFFGVGLNNWSYWVSNKYGPEQGWNFVAYRYGTAKDPGWTVPVGSNLDNAQAAPAHSLAALTAGELGIPGLLLFTIVWMRWFQMGAGFLWPRTLDPMRRVGIGLFFGTWGIFLQSITEWVFHQSPIYYTFNIMLGVLASLCYLKKQERRASRFQPSDADEYGSPRLMETDSAEVVPDVKDEEFEGEDSAYSLCASFTS